MSIVPSTDYPTANCTDGDVRLIGRDKLSEGVVQICLNGTWGTLCTTNWDSDGANVVCMQLGFLHYYGKQVAQ